MMGYLKLEEVMEQHLLGSWRIRSRQVNSSNLSNVFAGFTCIQFKEKVFVGSNGKRRKGTWEIIREEEMIYNPQVKFYLGKTITINSIITNLMTVSQTEYRLILYFDTGMELVLEKDDSLDLCKQKLPLQF